jgi:hypothetical protein
VRRRGRAQGSEGEEEEEGERGGEGRGAHLGDPNSGDHRLQDLGHHGERERCGRGGGCCTGELNEGKRPGERGAHGEGTGARGARAELGRAGLGRTAGQNPVALTTTDRNSIHEAKSETRPSNTRD